ncbi:MAG: hypothetical protein A2491_17265 [Bacteroidetes bacterium RIFOXYC12_FULL_35_7]|nr:MAG: hypothetical protein A2491_17265 [Bacteroidetes bacterium RIFOXYC12_FULL_35_7]
MELKIQKYLYDIITSINSIYEYLGENRDFNEYSKNKLLRRAVERELEIIGEASNRILKLDSEFPIDNARKIVDLRNWVIHGYDKVDDVIIWGILSNHLPKLKDQVENLMK